MVESYPPISHPLVQKGSLWIMMDLWDPSFTDLCLQHVSKLVRDCFVFDHHLTCVFVIRLRSY